MTYPNHQPASHPTYRPEGNPADDLDLLLIDDEFDDSLDRQLFALRESLADFRTL